MSTKFNTSSYELIENKMTPLYQISTESTSRSLVFLLDIALHFEIQV